MAAVTRAAPGPRSMRSTRPAIAPAIITSLPGESPAAFSTGTVTSYRFACGSRWLRPMPAATTATKARPSSIRLSSVLMSVHRERSVDRAPDELAGEGVGGLAELLLRPLLDHPAPVQQ